MATCRVLLSALALVALAAVATAQANDDCANAAVILEGITPFDNSGATTTGSPLDAFVCDMGPVGDEDIALDLWYRFTPTVSKIYEITTVNLAGFDTRLAVYDQATCPDDPALAIACNDDQFGPPFEAGVIVSLSSGNTYTIRLGSYDLFTGGGPGSVYIGDPILPAPPLNDDCANAVPIFLGSTPVDTRLATDGTGLPLDPLICDMGNFGDEQLYQDVWFSHTPTATQNWIIRAVNSGGFDSRLAIYEQSSCPDDPLNVIACNDDYMGGPRAGVNVHLTLGTDYMVRFGSYDSNTFEAPGDLLIESPPPVITPSNDDCANALILPAGFGSFAYDATGATTDGANALGFCDYGLFGDEQNTNDVWFQYTSSSGGCTYISTLGQAGTDTRLTVYDSTGCPDDPADILACADEEVLPPAPPFEAGLDVQLSAGQTYLIRLGTYDTPILNGIGTLIIGAGPQAAANNGGGNPGAPGCVNNSQFQDACNGDGGDQMGCTDCPCTNNLSPGTVGGCLNSSGAGARLVATGSTSVSLGPGATTDLRFGMVNSPPGSFCILNSGAGLAPGNVANPCFGLDSGTQAAQFDGLRCAVSNTQRHGGRSADANGAVGVSNSPWGGEGGPPAGLAVAFGGFSAGQTRHFQVIHRDDPLLGCMRGLNTSQAVEVTFSP